MEITAMSMTALLMDALLSVQAVSRVPSLCRGKSPHSEQLDSISKVTRKGRPFNQPYSYSQGDNSASFDIIMDDDSTYDYRVTVSKVPR